MPSSFAKAASNRLRLQSPEQSATATAAGNAVTPMLTKCLPNPPGALHVQAQP